MQLAHGEIGTTRAAPAADRLELAIGRPGRTLSLYPAQAGYDLQEELDFLSNRAMEPNVFFTSRFLAPAMPRLEDREIRLAIIRDETRRPQPPAVPDAVLGREARVLPSARRSSAPGPIPSARSARRWSMREDAAETIDNLLEALGRADSNLPRCWCCRISGCNGPFAQMAQGRSRSRATCRSRSPTVSAGRCWKACRMARPISAKRSSRRICARCAGSGA